VTLLRRGRHYLTVLPQLVSGEGYWKHIALVPALVRLSLSLSLLNLSLIAWKQKKLNEKFNSRIVGDNCPDSCTKNQTRSFVCGTACIQVRLCCAVYRWARHQWRLTWLQLLEARGMFRPLLVYANSWMTTRSETTSQCKRRFRIGSLKVARTSRNKDELSSWSCVGLTSLAFPAKTTLYFNTKSDPDPNTDSIFPLFLLY